jgi:hypothetical protein
MQNPEQKKLDLIKKIQDIIRKRKVKNINVNDLNKIISIKPAHKFKIENKVIQNVAKTVQKLKTQVENTYEFMPFDKKKNSNKFAYSFKHSGDCGDLIYSLPAIEHYGGGELFLNPNGFLNGKKYDGSKSGFDPKLIEMLKPLLEAQDYISAVNNWALKKVDFDLDYFRKTINKKENLCESILETFNVPFIKTQTPWVKCDHKKIAPIVIARSFRYRNKKMN